MGLFRGILRWFGFHREARVQITAPGIEVTLAGDPTQVRALMGVIRTELERKARRDRRLNKVNEREVVRPTELDEMDSPYALPEAVVMPVGEEERSGERPRLVAMSTRERSEWPPAMSAADVHQATAPDTPVAGSLFSVDDVESARTALTARPSEEDRPTPPVATGVPAVTAGEVDTLEVDRRLKRVTRPLYPSLKEGGGSKPA